MCDIKTLKESKLFLMIFCHRSIRYLKTSTKGTQSTHFTNNIYIIGVSEWHAVGPLHRTILCVCVCIYVVYPIMWYATAEAGHGPGQYAILFFVS